MGKHFYFCGGHFKGVLSAALFSLSKEVSRALNKITDAAANGLEDYAGAFSNISLPL